MYAEQVGSTVVAEDDPVAAQVPQEAGDTTAAADIPTGAGTGIAHPYGMYCSWVFLVQQVLTLAALHWLTLSI